MGLFRLPPRVFTALCILALVATACLPAESDAESAQQAEVADTGLAEAHLQRGVALSPRSYDGTDLPDFLNIVDGSVDLLMHAADWAELADETSSFRVLSELADQRDLATMIVVSPSNGTGLLRPLDDPTVAGYLASLRTFLTDYQPDYLGLGNELNLVASNSMDDFDQAVALYEMALPIVRELAPDTTVFVTFQYEWMLGRRDGWFGRQNDPALNQWDLLDRFGDADALAITTYPGLVHDTPADMDVDYYAQIRDHSDLPIIVTESGWTADEDLDGLAGSEEEQEIFAASLLAEAERLDMSAAVWTFLFATQVAEPAFADMGLWSDDGLPRPAWFRWSGIAADENVPSAASPEPGAVRSEPPTTLRSSWSVPFPGELPLSAVADADGRPFVYVAAKTGGVAVVSTNGSQGAVVGRVPISDLGGADVTHLVQDGDRLVVSLGDFFSQGNAAGIGVIDISDPRAPLVQGFWQTSDALHGAADVWVDGDIAYVAAMEHGVFVFDISESTPKLLSQLELDANFPKANPSDVSRPNARGLGADANYLYVANDAGGLRIVDRSDPTQMSEVGRYINDAATKQQAYNDVLIVDSYAYVSLDYCGFEVIDVSDPTAPAQVAWLDPWDCNSLSNLWLNSPGHGNELFYDSGRGTIWMSAGDSEVIAIDMRDPARPMIATAHGAAGNDRGTYGLGASTGPDAMIFATYITTIVPFQGRSSELVALVPE